MITVGLDFGTHQSKVCVETQEGAELHYTFFKFPDCNGRQQYTLPSIIHESNNGCLKYGYIPKGSKGKIIRYFKQGTFTQTSNMTQNEAVYYSIWYLAYIIFELEKVYGQDFSIQMGVPTDGGRFSKQKKLAVRIVLSAYHLAEEVFNNDQELFLRTPISELRKKTEFLPYDAEQKMIFGIQVLPEAYACLMPLIHQSKIDGGMSLMIDIGGGTTDISFFTIEKESTNKPKPANERLHVYDFYSINKGLNFLSDADNLNPDRLDSNIDLSGSDIQSQRKGILHNEINNIQNGLIKKLRAELKRQSQIPESRLMDALKTRPIIYTGGGSTFASLRKPYGGFKDIIHISHKEWRREAVDELNRISELGLCPILSTAYGLSIHTADDNVQSEPFTELFKGLRNYVPERNQYRIPQDKYRISVYDDWDSIK
jgi:hypothetical protein